MQQFRRAWLILASLTALLPLQIASAQTQISEPEVSSYIFGEQITFRAQANIDTAIQQAQLIFQLPDISEARKIPAEVTPLNGGSSQLQATYKLAGQNLTAFSTLEYYFELVDSRGEKYSSPLAQFDYLDNRFEWQTLPGDPFQIHWYNGNGVAAKSVQQVAQSGMEHIQELIELVVPKQVEIYIYPDTTSLQEVLAHTGHTWTAGRAAPEKSVILTALPPGPDQQVLIEQRVPHELMHVSLYLTLGEDYFRLPVWLSEGLASAAELYPNPDYPLLVKTAYEQAGLPAMTALCPAFPDEASAALMAYAQSTSFARFILSHYGKAGMQSLVQAYASGRDCENGPVSALGISLSALEQQWRDETFGEQLPTQTQTDDFVPWLVILVATLAFPLLVGLIILLRRPSTR